MDIEFALQPMIEQEQKISPKSAKVKVAKSISAKGHSTQIMTKVGLEEVERTLAGHIVAVTYLVSLQDGYKVIDVSPSLEYLGITAENWGVNGRFGFKSLHEDDRDQLENKFRESCITGRTFFCDYRLRCPNGEVRWFRDTAAVVMDKDGKAAFLRGIMLDVTDAKAMEDELTKHRRHLEQKIRQRTEVMERRIAVLESCNLTLAQEVAALKTENTKLKITQVQQDENASPLASSVARVVLDQDAWIIEMNEEAVRLSGWDARSAIGHKFDEVIHLVGTDIKPLLQVFDPSRDEDREVRFDNAVIKYLDGHSVPVSGRLVPLEFLEHNRGFALSLAERRTQV